MEKSSRSTMKFMTSVGAIKVIMVFAMLNLYLPIVAQNYNASNSLSRIALVYYFMGENGFFQKKENVNLQEVFSVVSTYGYNKKSHELYVETDKANCIVTVNEDIHKILKKSKSIPLLNAEELTAKANAISQEMAERYERINTARQKHLTDSIEQVKRDSMRKATEDSLRLVAEQEKETNYKRNHRWFAIPSKRNKIYCNFCEKSIDTSDSLFCYGINNDTLYWAGFETGKLDIEIRHIHAGKMPDNILRDKDFIYHRRVYNDSLTSKIKIDMELASEVNRDHYVDYLRELKSVAPNGLFLDWGWDKEYSSIEFNFKYMNTNKNTIKYIEVFFVVTNDVGDVRKTGSFRGTGPLEEWESASWNWDHSSYYVTGDASKMNISKVIITYMNGTKVTIPKNKLRFN